MTNSLFNKSQVLLVRHAQSEANVDYRKLHHTTNMKIDITPTGEIQAFQTGKFLQTHIQELLNKNKHINGVVLWNSPYKRTRNTATAIKKATNFPNYKSHESVYLVERNFGLVDAIDGYFDSDKYEDMREYYNRHKINDDEFFCKPPLGESPYDLAMRMHQFYQQEIVSDPYNVHIIVSHGASLRALNLMVEHMPYEKFLSANPSNASVNLMGPNGLVEIFCPSTRTS